MTRAQTSTHPHSGRRFRFLLLVFATALLLVVSSASAGASSSIEGVWAFDNGEIAITPEAGGTFVGTVVDETKFAECTHPVGQKIWTSITPQPDGSFWGSHQWYFEGTCAENPEPGPTAWRVMEGPAGSKYLRVCLSTPGSSQPAIPPTGPEVNVTYGCVNSALTAPLPTTSGSGAASERLSYESSKECLSARIFRIHIREPKYDPFKKVLVTIRGRKIATARRGGYVVATVDLKGFKRGAFTVKIQAVTILGHHLSGKRTYHTCAKKAIRRKPTKHHR
jgi:hypothetical protein